MTANIWKLDAEGLKLLAPVDKVAREVIGPLAPTIDKQGRFPKENIEALRRADLMGLVSAKSVGGQGQGLRAAVAVAERIARECPSTAMILMMHYCATAVLESYGTEAMRRSVAVGGKLATLAFSESGSRSHFWVPVSTATKSPEGVRLDAAKQLITSAGNCDLYVWSSRPAAVMAPVSGLSPYATRTMRWWFTPEGVSLRRRFATERGVSPRSIARWTARGGNASKGSDLGPWMPRRCLRITPGTSCEPWRSQRTTQGLTWLGRACKRANGCIL